VVLARRHSSTDCDMEGATDRWASAAEVRKADRSRASGPPSACELTDVRTACPTENFRSSKYKVDNLVDCRVAASDPNGRLRIKRSGDTLTRGRIAYLQQEENACVNT